MCPPVQSLTVSALLSTSPRLLQAVRLLQMSALEFEQELQQQLGLNPFLEESTPDEPTADDLDDDAARSEREAREADSDSESQIEVTSIESDDRDELLPEGGFDTPTTAGAPGDGEACDRIVAPTGLREHLHQQLRGARLSGRAQLAAMLVVETIDDDGYLRGAIEETALAVEVEPALTPAEIEAGIEAVQQLDPPGVAARDLAECLCLQLAALPPRTPGMALALALAAGHLEALARHDYGTLRRQLDCSLPALSRAQALIRCVDPKPGQRFTAARSDYIVPDVIVIARGKRLTAIVNPAVLPRVKLNLGCVRLLRACVGSRHPAMQQQLQEARWLLRSAEQRHQTILRVAEAVVARQRAFFQYGEIALKPLILRDIADQLSLNESTLSRATANKYMATPRGIFEFRHFFSRPLGTDTGGTCSASAVRALIREMIDGEDRAEPMSDVRLARQLSDHGICVARRTVTKYRNQLKLPPVELRHLP